MLAGFLLLSQAFASEVEPPRLSMRESVEVPFFGEPVWSVESNKKGARVNLRKVDHGVVLNFGKDALPGEGIVLEGGCTMRRPFVNEDLGQIWAVIWRDIGSGRSPAYMIYCYSDENGREGLRVYSIDIESGGDVLAVTGSSENAIKVIARAPMEGFNDEGFGYYSGKLNIEILIEIPIEDEGANLGK